MDMEVKTIFITDTKKHYVLKNTMFFLLLLCYLLIYIGAFLYTRDATVDPALIPRLEKAVARANLPYQWKDFTMTDNSCKKQTEDAVVLREKFLSKVLITEEQQLQEQLTRLRTSAVNTIVTEEKEAEKSISFLEKELEKFEAEIVKDAREVEKKIESIL